MSVNRKYNFFLIVCIFSLLISCKPNLSHNKNKDIKLEFKGIEVDDNTLFLLDEINNKIFAINTDNDKIIYKYDFHDYVIFPFVEIDNNIFLIISDNKDRVIKIDVKSGAVKEIKTDFSPYYLTKYNKEIWISDVDIKGQIKNIIIYNPATDEKRKKEAGYVLNEGSNISRINDITYVVWVSHEYEKRGFIINTKNNSLIIPKFDKKYLLYSFLIPLNDYLDVCGKISDDPMTYVYDLYKIESFEPFKVKLVISSNEGFHRIYEDKDYLYCFSNVSPTIFKYSKNDYSLKIKKEIPGISTYSAKFKDQFFWALNNHDKTNVFTVRINKNDLSSKEIY